MLPYLKDVSTGILALAALWIAWEQKRIADTRARADLYDRRLRVYEAAKTLLVRFLFEGQLSSKDFVDYKRGTADAEFLFSDNPEALKQLDLLSKQTVELIRLQQREPGTTENSAELEKWFVKQFDALKFSFQRSMQLTPCRWIGLQAMWKWKLR